MTDTTLANTETATDATSQVQTKTYSQEEFDAAMARTRSSVENKVKKQYAELGDPEYLRDLVSQAEQLKQQEQLKRGEFEKTLSDIVSKKDAEIQKRDALIKDYRVNTPLLNAAAQFKSVNPDQVRSLLANQVELLETGEVIVLDDKRQVRYNDSGQLLQVNDLVKEFLDQNPHFVQPTPATSNTKSSVQFTSSEFDLSKLDFKNPEHRKLYAEARKAGKI